MFYVPEVDLRRDCRFSLEENWFCNVVPAVEEAAKRGLTVTPLTVFHPVTGNIEGWLLHGWKPPPPVILWPIVSQCEDKQ